MAIQTDNKECCGCGACESICPKHAITMREDRESFLYPVIDHELCVDCGSCEKTCPLTFDRFSSPEEITAYVGTYKSDDVIFNSSSGGAFTALYETYIKKGYKVYGAMFDDHFKVVHGSAVTAEECEKFRKSKYVQSYYNDCYEEAAKDLRSGRSVLFSGVSCQCAALLSYLRTKNTDDSNLVVVNVLCHGVPSQKLFDAYIEESEKEEGAKVSEYSFKNKKTLKGKINSRTACITFSNGNEYIRTMDDDPFVRAYYKRLFYRPSCGVCRFTRNERLSDFTICDAWRSETIDPDLDPYAGVSMILFNTDKAKEVLNDIRESMKLKEAPSDWALTSQRLFSKPTNMHENRDMFFELWPEEGFKKAVFKSTKPSVEERLKNAIPNSLKKRMKHLIK